VAGFTEGTEIARHRNNPLEEMKAFAEIETIVNTMGVVAGRAEVYFSPRMLGGGSLVVVIPKLLSPPASTSIQPGKSLRFAPGESQEQCPT
jgi:hypothetical protein